MGASVWSGLPEPGGKTELFGLTGNTYYHVMGVPSYYVHAGYGNRIQVEDITAEDEEEIVNHTRELVRRAGQLGLDYDDWFVELWDEPQESNVALYGVPRNQPELLLAPVVDAFDAQRPWRVALFTPSDQPMRFSQGGGGWRAARRLVVESGQTLTQRCWLMLHQGDARRHRNPVGDGSGDCGPVGRAL